MKKLICIIMCAVFALPLFSCSNNISEEKLTELCSWYWESDVDIMQFTKDGKILRNFQFLHESESSYTITDTEITMYADNSTEDSLTFPYRLENDKLYIGELEYTKYAEVKPQDEKSTENDTDNGIDKETENTNENQNQE